MAKRRKKVKRRKVTPRVAIRSVCPPKCSCSGWMVAFLLISGIILLIPQIGRALDDMFNGMPYIKMIVGAIAVFLALLHIFGKK